MTYNEISAIILLYK